ncbi:alpha/beta fold hydrolase [Streptosporangium subroseum]|uniref:alpha/beta fold hydrolase n=1 Tax=Streptosporangium subroseum TaxID=106412 RepID=UPI003086F60D|nr:hypothetical protein OHB15_29965 [Streptosporangium subroseum]
MEARIIGGAPSYRRMRRHSLGPVAMATIESVPQRVRALLDEVPATAEEGVQLHLVHAGRLAVEQGRGATVASAGQALFSTDRSSSLDADEAKVFAVSQRPLSAIAFGEPASVAAWKTKPGWGIVSSADRTINPDVERFGYKRAGLRKVIEIDAPHLVMRTHPAEVAAFITDAIAELG